MASPFLDHDDEDEDERGRGMNGHAAKPVPRMPKQHRVTDSQQVRDAEEFELEGLISDIDEDADDVGGVGEDRKKVNGVRKEVV